MADLIEGLEVRSKTGQIHWLVKAQKTRRSIRGYKDAMSSDCDEERLAQMSEKDILGARIGTAAWKTLLEEVAVLYDAVLEADPYNEVEADVK